MLTIGDDKKMAKSMVILIMVPSLSVLQLKVAIIGLLHVHVCQQKDITTLIILC